MAEPTSPVLAEEAFRAGPHQFSRMDVLRWAERADAPWHARSARRWAPRDDDDGEPEAGLLSATEAAADAFRYARGLEEAEALTAWLEARGLSVEEWFEALQRDVADGGGAPFVGRSDAIEPAFCLADVASTGVLDEPAARLAARAAVWLDGGALEARSVPAPVGIVPWQALGVDAATLRGCDARLAAIDEAWERWAAARLTAEALGELVGSNGLDWMVLHVALSWWPTADAAAEALWCVRDDGEPLASVAQDAGVDVREVTALLGAMPDALRDPLLSASAGDTIGPIAGVAGWAVATLREKQRASLSAPQVADAARRLFEIRAASALVDAHVRWPAVA